MAAKMVERNTSVLLVKRLGYKYKYTYIGTGRRCYVYFSLKPDDVKNERGKWAADIITKNVSYMDILFTHGIICYM